MEIKLQLHGHRGGGGGTTIKTSAPGSSAVSGLDSMAEGQRLNLRELLAGRKGRKFTDKTGGNVAETTKKALIGE